MQVLPIAYLFAMTATQVNLLDYCFGATIEPTSLTVILGSLTLFSIGYVTGFNRSVSARAVPISQTALFYVASALLAASLIYCAIGSIRVVYRWDAFSLGPTLARTTLVTTRTGISALGFLNSTLMGAPAVLALLVCTYAGRLPYESIFRGASLVTFGAFVYLQAIEGGRLPFLIAISFLISAVGFRLLRGHKLRESGLLFLFALGLVSAAAFVFSYREFENRELMRGRETADEAQSVYRNYVSDFLPAPTPSAQARDRLTQDPTETQSAHAMQKTSAVVGCFYFSHAPKSIERIVSKGADKNLFGFYMMPNYYKLAHMVGIADQDWLAYSDYYEITGMYSGLLGALLIDFSWFGLLLMGVIGLVCGLLVSLALTAAMDKSPLVLAAAIVPTAIFLIPVVDLISSTQFQSTIPWLALTFGVFALGSYRSRSSLMLRT